MSPVFPYSYGPSSAWLPVTPLSSKKLLVFELGYCGLNSPKSSIPSLSQSPLRGLSPSMPKGTSLYRDVKGAPRLRGLRAVSYTHLRAHETRHDLVCRLLLEKKK